ncbi:MAG: polysaccharide pyruvyl transferase CsaB, partial [Patescibacteria group bacterium]
MNILGVRIDPVDTYAGLEKAQEFLLSDSQHTIFTPNPEMLVDAQKDEYFRDVLNSGSLNLCDGFGLRLVSRGKLQRVPGIDFFLALCLLALRMGKRVHLLGGGDMQKA